MTNQQGNDLAVQCYDDEAVAGEVRAVREEYAEEEAEVAEIEAAENAAPVLSVEQVEQIARRVLRESA
ncbi:MAG: hypothetical protein ACRDS0_36265 [Pseudonocardiaceae bacterium]